MCYLKENKSSFLGQSGRKVLKMVLQYVQSLEMLFFKTCVDISKNNGTHMCTVPMDKLYWKQMSQDQMLQITNKHHEKPLVNPHYLHISHDYVKHFQGKFIWIFLTIYLTLSVVLTSYLFILVVPRGYPFSFLLFLQITVLYLRVICPFFYLRVTCPFLLQLRATCPFLLYLLVTFLFLLHQRITYPFLFYLWVINPFLMYVHMSLHVPSSYIFELLSLHPVSKCYLSV